MMDFTINDIATPEIYGLGRPSWRSSAARGLFDHPCGLDSYRSFWVTSHHADIREIERLPECSALKSSNASADLELGRANSDLRNRSEASSGADGPVVERRCARRPSVGMGGGRLFPRSSVEPTHSNRRPCQLV